MMEIAEFKNVVSLEDEITHLKSELMEQAFDKALENFYPINKITPTYFPFNYFNLQNSDEQIKLKFKKLLSLENLQWAKKNKKWEFASELSLSSKKKRSFDLQVFTFKSHGVENLAIEQKDAFNYDIIESISNFSLRKMMDRMRRVKTMTVQIAFENWIKDNNYHSMHLTKPIEWNDALINDKYTSQYVLNQQNLLNLSQLEARRPLTKFVATLHRVNGVSYLPIVVVSEIECTNEEITEKVSCEINAIRSKKLENLCNAKLKNINSMIQMNEEHFHKLQKLDVNDPERNCIDAIEQNLKKYRDLIENLNNDSLSFLTQEDEEEIKKVAISKIIEIYKISPSLDVYIDDL